MFFLNLALLFYFKYSNFALLENLGVNTELVTEGTNYLIVKDEGENIDYESLSYLKGRKRDVLRP